MDIQPVHLLFPLIACVAIYWFALKISSSKITTQHRLLAERFGLDLEQPPATMAGFVRHDPTVYGHYRDREVSFSAPGKGYKGTRHTESLLKLELKDRRIKAQISPGGPLGKLSMGKNSKGEVKWESGDSNFDQKVYVKTKQPAIFEKVLTDERRERLANHLAQSKATIYVGDGTIAYAKLGLIGDDATRQLFEEAVELFCDLAEVIEG